MQTYAPVVLRIGISLVFIWFGVSQVMNPLNWISWLPRFTDSLPVSKETLVLMNGGFEVLCAILLILGIYTRFVAALVTLHALSIVMAVGFTAIGVRDFGIFAASLATFLYGPDAFSLDSKFRKSFAGAIN